MGTVWFRVKFRLDTAGIEVRSAHTATHPVAVGWVTVTLTTTADTPVAGTPPRPVICTATSAPAATGAAAAPSPVRVSRTRLGATVTNVPSAWVTQVKVVLPPAKVPSVAVAVTVKRPTVVGVPEIRPVPELMTSPDGRPEAA